nr:ABC transporter substrate-binding protein [Lachnospiraceae bacterium]
MKKKLISFFVILQIVTAVALCGCAGGTNGDGTEQQSGSDSSVKYGGKITVGITQDLDSLDPHTAVAAGTKEVLINIFDGLIKVASNGDFVPAVASSYEISEDGTKYDFVLRK